MPRSTDCPYSTTRSLAATYRPPLAVAGDAADVVLGFQVAQACVRRFVDAVAGSLAAAALPA